jgi:hypothetical protein
MDVSFGEGMILMKCTRTMTTCIGKSKYKTFYSMTRLAWLYDRKLEADARKQDRVSTYIRCILMNVYSPALRIGQSVLCFMQVLVDK